MQLYLGIVLICIILFIALRLSLKTMSTVVIITKNTTKIINNIIHPLLLKFFFGTFLGKNPNFIVVLYFLTIKTH